MKLMKLSCLLTMFVGGFTQLHGKFPGHHLPYQDEYSREFSGDEEQYLKSLVPQNASDIYMGKIHDGYGTLFVFYRIVDVNMPHNLFYGFIRQQHSYPRMMTCVYSQPSRAMDASFRCVTNENGVFEFYRQMLYPMYHGQFSKMMLIPRPVMTGHGTYNNIPLIVKHIPHMDE